MKASSGRDHGDALLGNLLGIREVSGDTGLLAPWHGGAAGPSVLAKRPAAARATPTHLSYMDSFRGAAILGVIFGHCFMLAFGSRYGAPSPTDFVLNIVEGCTVLFVFISGFLFHHVFYRKFDYDQFVLSKAKTILLPFAIVSFVLVAFGELLQEKPAYILTHGVLGGVDDFFNTYLASLITGGAGLSLWYVPFITLVFVLSPLFIRFIEASGRRRLAILLAALLIGLFVNRSPHNADKLQNGLYFLFFYLFGIYASLHRRQLERWLADRTRVLCLWAGVVALAVLQAEIGFNGGYYGDFFEWQGPNLDYVQKSMLIFALCGSFIAFPIVNGRLLNGLAKDSFGLFFVHNLVLLLLASFVGLGAIETGVKLVDLLIWGVVVTMISQIIVSGAKRALGRHSRLVIGA